MTSLSFDEATIRYPMLANQVLQKLAAVQKTGVDPRAVLWHTVLCHDDPEQPLDEAACADVLLTGSLLCRRGLSGRYAGHFACFCDADCLTVAALRTS